MFNTCFSIICLIRNKQVPHLCVFHQESLVLLIQATSWAFLVPVLLVGPSRTGLDLSYEKWNGTEKTEKEGKREKNKILAWELKTMSEIVTSERPVQHFCSFPFQWDGFTIQLMPWNKNSVGGQEKIASWFAVNNPFLKIQERKKQQCAMSTKKCWKFVWWIWQSHVHGVTSDRRNCISYD